MVVACLLLVLAGVALVLPVPYVTMSPGPTVDVLGKHGDEADHRGLAATRLPHEGRAAADDRLGDQPHAPACACQGDARLGRPGAGRLPRDVIYPPKQSANDVEQQSTAEMIELPGHRDRRGAHRARLPPPGAHRGALGRQGHARRGAVAGPRPGAQVAGRPIARIHQVTAAIQKAGVGKPVAFVVRRDGKQRRVLAKPGRLAAGHAQGGRGGDPRHRLRLPLRRLRPAQRGHRRPQRRAHLLAGRLRPAHPRVAHRRRPSRRHGNHRRSADALDPSGGSSRRSWQRPTPGPRSSSCPPANCAEAEQAHVDKDKIRLVKAPTMHSAVASLKAYARDKHADLPSCR